MFHKTIVYICILFFVLGKTYSQVNMQTGSAVFSIPVFNWKEDKSHLTSVVALSYNSGNGLKVDEVASNIGQGWTLIAGGVITRMQVGEPDDQMAYAGNGSETDIRRYPAGYLYSSVPPENGCPDALTRYPIYRSRNQVYKEHNKVAEDKQLDYFSFQFNGKAGMFVLDRVNGDLGIPLGDTKMKISFTRNPSWANGTHTGIRTTINSFTIQDVDGLKYKFSVLGITKVLENNYCDAGLVQRQTQPKFNSNKVYYQAGFENLSFVNSYMVGSWYLSEIEDPFTNRKIIFNYLGKGLRTIAGQSVTYNAEGNYAIVNYKTSNTEVPDLTSITYPDLHTVTFNYGKVREDLKGQKSIASIDVSYNGRFLSRHILNTSYFILNRYGTPVTPYQKNVARLCLLSVQKIGVDLKEDSPPFKFDYYLGSSTADDVVPPPFSYAKDIWGFYNAKNTAGANNENIDITSPISTLNTSHLKGVCFIRTGQTGPILNPKTGYAKNGLLRQIIYPTGGTLTYEYTQNTGIIAPGSTTLEVGGVHVTKTTTTDGGYSSNCDPANAITTNYNFVLPGGTASSLWGLEQPVNEVISTTYYNPEYRYYKYAGCFPFGCCEYKFRYPGILSQNQAISLSDIQNFMIAMAPVLNAVSVVTSILDVINLVCYSSGFMAWAAVVMDIVGGLVTLVLSCTNNLSQTRTSHTYYNSDLNAVSPLPVQYKRVEIVENPGTIGKTVHEFTSSDDYPVWEPTNPNFTAKQRGASWAYGLPKKITVYNQAGNKLTETENQYNYNYAKSIIDFCPDPHPPVTCNPSGIPTSLVSCKCLVTKSSSQRDPYWRDPDTYNPGYRLSSTADMKVEFYGMYTGRVELTQSAERTYSQTNPSDYVEDITSYSYNLYNNYEANTITSVKSNGDQISKRIKYSSDYVGGILTTLVNQNIVSLPVATTTEVSKITGNTGIRSMQETVTEFTQVATGAIKPSRIIEQRTAQPLLGTDPWLGGLSPYQGPGTNTSAYKINQTFFYDVAGNLIGLADEGNRKVTNIYDYQDKYIIASVINADPIVDNSAYTSFEVDNSYGGWSMAGGTAVYNSGLGITGTRSFSLLGRTFTRILNTSKPYILSFWAMNSNVAVTSGSSLTKSGPTINGFTYYEYAIASGTTSISISGNSIVDELRIYPKMARMRTVTYDPLIGKTSECDENNRTTYYEYDNLGRMRFIKDEKSNIIKMYEYNNVSEAKLNGCPGIYYNKLISEKFSRSNCSPGYWGDSILLSVPANTYSSTISQQDADAQAENYLLTNGPAQANSTGNCFLIYYNDEKFADNISEGCPPGYTGGTVRYTVPAGRYSSIESKVAANQLAQDDIDANAIAYANDPANRVCTFSTDPVWEWDNINSYCQSINGNLPAHLFVFEIDVNPNSPTYNQTRWTDEGPNDACPPNTYYSAVQSALFTRNNCTSGYVGTSVFYTVPAGKYSSTVSQAAADQLATNDINANGQAYANTNGECVPECSNFKFHVPNSVATNLYIRVTQCNGTVTVLNWNTQILYDETGVDYKEATLCLKTLGFITFRYGANGSAVSIPEITVTKQGACQISQ